MKTLLSIALLVLANCRLLSAQHIREQDKAYSTSIVREINLNHPSNQFLFGKRALLSQVLIEATENERCKVYNPYHTDEELSTKELISNISYPTDSCGFEEYLPSKLYIIELQEEFIFDKNRSEFKFIPKYITLFIPPEVNYRGIMQPVASWKYEDCEKIFRLDSRAFSEARSFGKSKVNFCETFLLRAYTSEIVKIGTDAPYFDQMHPDPTQAFLMGKEEEYKIQEMVYKAFHP
jgi:hypothetical protein